MRVRCINNDGLSIRNYEKKKLSKEELGRFGSTEYTTYNGLEIGKEYVVMGMHLGEFGLSYLVDDGGVVSFYPYPLFEVINNEIDRSWFFKALTETEELYPYTEATWGYYELVFDTEHYEKLIDGDSGAEEVYYKRKAQLENS